jgi:polyferredoxin
MTTDHQIQSILERNKRVEQDKRWETSWMRRISIAVITWILAVVFLTLIDAENALLAALVPTGGYVLSTLSASPIRKYWEKYQK